MTNLIQRLLRKEKKPLIEKTLSADEIEPFFQAHGINIDTIGFPNLETRHNSPLLAYWADFENVKATPVKVNDVVKIIITGKYETQAKASYQDSGCGWHPGTPSRYSFRIDDGNLSFKEKK